MGFGGISIWQLLIVLLIVILIFGTKRLKGMGKDLGGAVKGFKEGITDESDKQEDADQQKTSAEDTNGDSESADTKKDEEKVN